MAQKVQVLLIDDIDGSDADETLTFSLDGVAYEIDLNSARATALRGALAPYRERARQPATVRRMSGRGVAKPGRDRERSAEIRSWAAAHGVKVSPRGRIPGAVVEQYDAAPAKDA